MFGNLLGVFSLFEDFPKIMCESSEELFVNKHHKMQKHTLIVLVWVNATQPYIWLKQVPTNEGKETTKRLPQNKRC